MATPVWTCGWECGQLAASVAAAVGQHWAIDTGTPTLSTTTVRSGARSLQCAHNVATIAVANPYTSSTRKIGRVYIQFSVLPTAVNTIFLWNDAAFAGPMVSYHVGTTQIRARVGNTIGSSGVTVVTGQWYRIDYDFNGNNGSGSMTCDVQVDGVACTQATRVATVAASTTLYVGEGGGTGGAAGNILFDDLVVSVTPADYPLGAGYVNHFVPTSDGTHNIAGTGDFLRTLTGTDILNATTTAYQLVDDVPLESGASVDWINMAAPTAATQYVECIFGPAPGISTPTDPPRAVEVIAGIHQATTATGNMMIRLNDNGTEGTVYTATTVAGVTSIAYKRAHFADPPSAASAWVIGGGGNGDFTDLRVRFGSPAALDVVPDQYFDCIMLEAEFAEAVGVTTPVAQIYSSPQAVSRASLW